MVLRFGANLNFLFCENATTILDKFRLARAAGFRGVEIACPDTINVESVVAAQKDNELDIVLINISLGNICTKIKMSIKTILFCLNLNIYVICVLVSFLFFLLSICMCALCVTIVYVNVIR